MLNIVRTRSFFLVLLLSSQVAFASGEFIDIYPKTEQDIELILETLEGNIQAPSADSSTPPILMMLHGPQAELFLRSTYSSNKMLVDQTAKLAAYGVLEVQICELWLRRNNHSKTELFPFISTVPYGASELTRLEEEEGYTEYSIDL